MAVIAIADLLDLVDSFAAQVLEGLNEFDSDGVAVGTFTYGAKQNQGRVLVLGDPEQEADLQGGANAALETSKAYPVLYERCKPLLLRLNSHVNKHFSGGIEGYLVDQDERMHFEMRDVYFACFGYTPNSDTVFSPVVSDLGDFAGSGPGAGVFTDGDPIDTDKYAPASLEIKNTGAGLIVAGPTFNVTCVKPDGTTEIKAVVIPGGGLAVGAVLPIGVTGTDIYTDITDITMTLGVNGDDITVQSILERVPAL